MHKNKVEMDQLFNQSLSKHGQFVHLLWTKESQDNLWYLKQDSGKFIKNKCF